MPIDLKLEGNLHKAISWKTILGIVENMADPVVHVPLEVMGFVDYGRVIKIGKWWKVIPIAHYPHLVEEALLTGLGQITYNDVFIGDSL